MVAQEFSFAEVVADLSAAVSPTYQVTADEVSPRSAREMGKAEVDRRSKPNLEKPRRSAQRKRG